MIHRAIASSGVAFVVIAGLLLQLAAAPGPPEDFEQAMNQGRYDEAAEIGKELFRDRPDSAVLAYNVGCALSLGDHTDEAIDWLLESAKLGFAGTRSIADDDDLDPVRDHARFALVELKVAANAKRRFDAFRDVAATAEPEVVLPPNHDPSVASPLIIALHGTGGTGEGMARAWSKPAAAIGAIVVAPDAMRPVRGTNGYSWTFRDEAEWLVLRALDRAQLSWNVGPVILTGFSQGANIALMLGQSHPDRFNAVIPVSGHYEADVAEVPTSGPRPAWFLIIGDRDPWAQTFEAAEEALSGAGMDVRRRVVRGMGHAFPRGRSGNVLLREALTWSLRERSAEPDDPWLALRAAAASAHGQAGIRAADFLAAHRPERDREIDPELLIENFEYAMRARREFSWASRMPDERFLNDVLPYAVLDETRERWRPKLYAVGCEIVRDCSTATEAAQALNRELFDAVGVHYDTGRKEPNQSPAESIEQGRATCTGLSILLVDACRAVGVPARVAGVASWNGKDGNHTWVEIWDGGWHFTGADEYDAKGLDRAWFTEDASRAVPGDPEHAVWASTWAVTGSHFPLAWNRTSRDVAGVDVSHRYIRPPTDPSKAAVRHLRAWESEGGERVAMQVRVLDPDGEVVHDVTTRAGRADLNDMPAVTLVPGVAYRLEVRWNDEQRNLPLVVPVAGEQTLDLRWDELVPASQGTVR